MNFRKILLCLILCSFLFACKTEKEIKFAFVTDTHIGRANCDDDLRETVKDINSMDDIDFVVITGDISNFGYDRELKEAKAILDELNKNWYIFPGNHDTKWSESGATSFKKIFGEERFAFKFGKYHFIGCGSGPEMRMGPGMVPFRDVEWLDSVMIQTKNEPVIYLNHYPLEEGLSNWYKIINILKKGNPQAVLSGHWHKNKLLDFDGIPGVTGRSNIRGKEEKGGYNLVTIKNDSIYFAERTPGGKTHDVWAKFSLGKVAFDNEKNIQPSYKINEQYEEVKTLWSIQDSSDIVSGMAANSKLIFYTNTAGYIRAVDINSGEIVWDFRTGNKVFSTPAVSENSLVVASTDGIIYCLDSGSGKLIWKFTTTKAIVASPVIEDDIVYIGSSEGKFRALSVSDGKLIWENTKMQGYIETKLLVDAKHIYFGDWGNRFYALDKNNGEIIWKWTNGRSEFYSPAACVPVSANGKIFIADPERFATAFDASTGEQIWRSNKYEARESIGISEDKSLIYIKTMKDTVVAVSTKGDEYKVEWTVNCKFGEELDPSPIVEKNGVVFVPTDNGCVYAIDRKAAKIKWIRKLSNTLINPILPLSDGQLIVSTMDGSVFKLKYSNNEK